MAMTNVYPIRPQLAEAEASQPVGGDGGDGNVDTYTIQLSLQASECVTRLRLSGLYGDTDEDVVTWLCYETLRKLFHQRG
jgi:hypothetical protein